MKLTKTKEGDDARFNETLKRMLQTPPKPHRSEGAATKTGPRPEKLPVVEADARALLRFFGDGFDLMIVASERNATAAHVHGYRFVIRTDDLDREARCRRR